MQSASLNHGNIGSTLILAHSLASWVVEATPPAQNFTYPGGLALARTL
jgi:hypothetical protein